MKQGRVHWFLPEELDEEQRAYYEALTEGPRASDPLRANPSLTDGLGRLQGPFNVRLLDPKIGTAIQEEGAALRFHISIPPRIVELVILETARNERSNIEWYSHSRRAKKHGMTDEDIEGIRTGGEAPGLSTEEALARRVAQEIVATRDLSDELFGEAEVALGPSAIFDIVSLIGHYQHTALSMRIWRIPPAEGVTETAFPD